MAGQRLLAFLFSRRAETVTRACISESGKKQKNKLPTHLEGIMSVSEKKPVESNDVTLKYKDRSRAVL